MEDPTPHDLETYLLEQPGWVSTPWLEAHFEITDRRIRKLGAGFLVSRPEGGYIHRDYATQEELDAYLRKQDCFAWDIINKNKLIRLSYLPRPRPVRTHIEQSLPL